MSFGDALATNGLFVNLVPFIDKDGRQLNSMNANTHAWVDYVYNLLAYDCRRDVECACQTGWEYVSEMIWMRKTEGEECVIKTIWILTEGIDNTMKFLDQSDIDWCDPLASPDYML